MAEKTDDRRARRRVAADFYAIELVAGGRYLRRVANVSRDGLLLESPLSDERPGQIVELRITLWDVDDNLLDSVALLDGFKWLRNPATPGTD